MRNLTRCWVVICGVLMPWGLPCSSTGTNWGPTWAERAALWGSWQDAPSWEPGPSVHMAQERLFLEERSSQGLVPGAWVSKERCVIGDSHGNRLVGAAKAKGEGECKVKDRKCLGEVAGGGTSCSLHLLRSWSWEWWVSWYLFGGKLQFFLGKKLPFSCNFTFKG